jgi:hypothetical protein
MAQRSPGGSGLALQDFGEDVQDFVGRTSRFALLAQRSVDGAPGDRILEQFSRTLGVYANPVQGRGGFGDRRGKFKVFVFRWYKGAGRAGRRLDKHASKTDILQC